MKFITKFIIALIIAIIAITLKNTVLTNAEYEIGYIAGWLICGIVNYEKIFK